ncbi:MAG: hypothetical protein EHM28_06225 [Spirochaetaceae bacterium]|nr:MAG: hypothetical protein EHM28_06225 [Spirochaetaceae bacterium]
MKKRSILHTAILALAFVVLVIPAWAEDRDPLLKETDGISAAIRLVERYPLVIEGNFKGFVRIILLEQGFDQINTAVILQWLSVATPEKLYKIDLAKTVSEIYPISITGIQPQPSTHDMPGLVLRITGINPYSQHEQKSFLLYVTEKGYNIK